MEGDFAVGTAPDLGCAETYWVALDALVESDSPRLSGENLEHAKALAEPDHELPPILVHRSTMRVIDGMHRVLAAAMRGRSEIEVRFVDCTAEEAFVLAVKANVTHGLALSIADRSAAAERIIRSHSDWSDRAIAAVTGLSHKTVGSIRRRTAESLPQWNMRRGRDGRLRPVDRTAGRLAVSRLLADRPDASLRQIASEAGVSAATVRDVRARLRRGEDPAPQRKEAAAGEPGELRQLRPVSALKPHTINAAQLVQILQRDPSLRLSESGRTLLRLLGTATLESGEWGSLIDNVPTHCVDIVAGLARACGDKWQEFAASLEQRRDCRSAPAADQVKGNRA